MKRHAYSGSAPGGDAVIRQAVSCDICGSEKKQSNHWFVAHDQGGELRIGGWNSRNSLRPGSRHLCGQACVHKLVDDFMAKALAARPLAGAADEAPAAEVAAGEQPAIGAALPRTGIAAPRAHAPTDTSLTSAPALLDPEFESSARLIGSPAPPPPLRPPFRAQPELVPTPGHSPLNETPSAGEPPRIASRNWRAEAWDRERERERRASTRGTEISAHRRAGP